MQLHPKFKLNGLSLSREDLSEVAYSWIKEGKDYERSAGDFILDWINSSPYIIAQTSGSTGPPKSIRLQKEFMINSAKATGRFFNLMPGDTALLCLPAQYIAGKMMLVRAMVLGLDIELIAPTNDLERQLNRTYDFTALVPTQVIGLNTKLSLLKTLIIGGAPIPKDLRDELALQPTAIYETYGMTETITHVALKRVSEPPSDFFTALETVTFEKDSRGCLVINAPKISEKKVVTNDLVQLHSEKKFSWLGRYDNVINSGGIKLIPEQIESKLMELLDQPFFVTALPHETLGEKLVLVVEGPVSSEDLEEQMLTLTSLGDYEKPKKIYSLPNFIRTSTGKINRGQTRQLITS